MKKSLKISIIILIILLAVLSLTIFSKQFTGKITDESRYYSYTKAICNETNFCQDYEIVCKGKETVNINILTGAAIQFSKDWEDPRDKETIEKLCDLT